MCGIGGFSLSPESKIKPRQLANAMLTALETRGGMASGFAYYAPDQSGLYKAAINGASLNLSQMPKNTHSAILHTRLATHGSIQDNRNNHPVLSPDHNIALVHNGVIYNHETVRLKLNNPIDFDVDTAVIPALIQEDQTLANLTELDGDAAIAWLDQRKPGVINVARLEHSPLTFAHLEDGSTVFASTEPLLWQVLIQLNLEPTDMFSAKEYTYYELRRGIISAFQELERPTHSGYGRYNYGYYRHQTSGAKSTYLDRYDDDLYWEEDLAYRDEHGLGLYYFYIESRDLLMKDSASNKVFYDIDEYDMFKNDIWYLQSTQDENYLMDFGRMNFDTGELLSYKQQPHLELEDIKKLGLVC